MPGSHRGAGAAALGIGFYTVLAGVNTRIVRAAILGCLEVLDLPGNTLLRTDQNGWIEVNTDGEQMWVEVERQ